MNLFLKSTKTNLIGRVRKAVITIGLPLAYLSCCISFAQETPAAPAGSSAGFQGSRTSIGEKVDESGASKPQIVVETVNPYVRAAFEATASDVGAGIRSLLGLPIKEWDIQIEIKVTGKPSDIISGRDLATEVKILPTDEFLLCLYARIHERFREDNFNKEMVRLFLQHEMLKPFAQNPNAFKGSSLAVPQWLVTGFTEHLRYRKNGTRGEIFRGIIQGGKMMTVEEILEIENVEPLDAMSRAIFEASAAALVSTLLEQDGGQRAFQSMLAGFTMDRISVENKDPAAILRQNFPALRESKLALGKWWALQIADMSELSAFEYYTLSETQKMLDEVLIIWLIPEPVGNADAEVAKDDRNAFQKWMEKRKQRGKAGNQDEANNQNPRVLPLTEFKKLLARKDIAALVEPNQRLIRLVQLRGFPLYRDLAARYSAIFDKLALADETDFTEEIKALEELRMDIDQIMERVGDVMNHHEATRAPATGGAFSDYHKMRERLENEPPPKRDDAISKHLDSLEREFE